MPDLPGLTIQNDVSLQPYHTFGLDVKARYLVTVTDPGQLSTLVTSAFFREQPHYILGGGSNVLFTEDFNGLIVRIAITGIERLEETDHTVLIEAGAGENWHELVMHCVEQGWGGIENLALIPGTVGAAPIQNIGAYGVELESVFEELDAVRIATGKSIRFSREEMQFGYRNSLLKGAEKGKYIITHVRLRLYKESAHQPNTEYASLKKKLEGMEVAEPGIGEVADAVIAVRQSKLPDPKTVGNSGSFFKNPEITASEYEALKATHPELPGYPLENEMVKVPAGWLIEQAGWKGKQQGGAGTYPRQALVLINADNAEPHEVVDLAKAIKKAVQQQFGITLEEEVNLVGS